MKIRILNNSIRLRLTQSEVKQFEEIGLVKNQIQFGFQKEQVLTYSLEQSSSQSLMAVFDSNHIKVLVPPAQASEWVSSSQVGIENNMMIGKDFPLRILVEKDFKCLTERSSEDESDHFPNPAETC